MKRKELQVGQAYFHQGQKYTNGAIVIVLDTKAWAPAKKSWDRSFRDYTSIESLRTARTRGTGSYFNDPQDGVLVARAFKPYSGTTLGEWYLALVRLKDIHHEVGDPVEYLAEEDRRRKASQEAADRRMAEREARRAQLKQRFERVKLELAAERGVDQMRLSADNELVAVPLSLLEILAGLLVDPDVAG